jgi:hypothetical protein
MLKKVSSAYFNDFGVYVSADPFGSRNRNVH